VLLCYLISLVPLAVLFVIQRTFYVYDDTRTPFFFTLVQCALVVATALTAQWAFRDGILQPGQLAAAVALGQSLATVVQVILATWLLHRRLGGIGVASWMGAVGRFAIAGLPAAAAGWLTFVLLGGADGWMLTDKILGAVGAAIIGIVVLAVYVGLLALLRAPELTAASGLARRLLPGRR
jgi:putative peptidoglycan lipid II flippase